MHFDSVFISNIYVEIYNFVKFQNVEFTALIFNILIKIYFLKSNLIDFFNYKFYEITVIFIFIFGEKIQV
jgi:hypothetical protein